MRTDSSPSSLPFYFTTPYSLLLYRWVSATWHSVWVFFFFSRPAGHITCVCVLCLYFSSSLSPQERKTRSKNGGNVSVCVYNNNNKKEESRRPSANFFRLKNFRFGPKMCLEALVASRFFFFLIFYLVSTLLYDDRARCVGE